MEQMKSKFLNYILIAGLFFQNLNSSYSSNHVSKESVSVKQTALEQKVSVNELFKLDALRTTSNFIKNHKSEISFENQIKKYGFKKTLEHNVAEKFYCIDLAQKYLQTSDPNLLSDKNYISIAGKLGKEREKFDKSPVNQNSKKVIKAQAKILKISTEHYLKLFKNNPGLYSKEDISQISKNIVKNTFSYEEYEQYFNNSYEAISQYYNELKGTLGLLERVFGSHIIERIKKDVLAEYLNYKNELYKPYKK